MIPGAGQDAFVRIAVTQGARLPAMEARYSDRAEMDQAAD